ncbi:hypothetical protein [Bradyrhizobium sp. LTSP857]|uniref:hypothetical protein n=1 Tax=Bradyrhizobium sp. LTSP857 TaxID=1619231 RepID=UPI000ADDAFA1|nr:hypothetical protein [Bradyrhizobium sp. LTSP857]
MMTTSPIAACPELNSWNEPQWNALDPSPTVAIGDRFLEARLQDTHAYDEWECLREHHKPH